MRRLTGLPYLTHFLPDLRALFAEAPSPEKPVPYSAPLIGPLIDRIVEGLSAPFDPSPMSAAPHWPSRPWMAEIDSTPAGQPEYPIAGRGARNRQANVVQNSSRA